MDTAARIGLVIDELELAGSGFRQARDANGTYHLRLARARLDALVAPADPRERIAQLCQSIATVARDADDITFAQDCLDTLRRSRGIRC